MLNKLNTSQRQPPETAHKGKTCNLYIYS